MASRHVLCAVDFSEGSRTALRYAAVVAAFADARLNVLTVTDALLVEGARASGRAEWLESHAFHELRTFCADTLGEDEHPTLLMRVGQPAAQILEAAAQLNASLIVMGATGITGVRKAFFGSTAERVLRDTAVSVLVTPTDCHAPATAGELAALLRRIVVPVDLTPASASQVTLASAIGGMLHVPLLLLHVVEPLSMPMKWRHQLPGVDMERRMRAEAAMDELCDGVPGAEAIVALGEPSEEIAKAAAARGAGLVVIGLHASDTARVGSVTYRVLSLARMPVLAVPRRVAANAASRLAVGTTCAV